MTTPDINKAAQDAVRKGRQLGEWYYANAVLSIDGEIEDIVTDAVAYGYKFRSLELGSIDALSQTHFLEFGEKILELAAVQAKLQLSDLQNSDYIETRSAVDKILSLKSRLPSLYKEFMEKNKL